MDKRQSGNGTVLEDELYKAGLIFLVAGIIFIGFALVCVLPNFPDMECIFHRIFGLYCPGCGGTRAVIALLRGHFVESFCYHPIVLYTVVIYGWFMFSHTLAKLRVPHVRGLKFREWHLYGALAIIVFHCVFRNVLYLGWGIPL